MLKVHYPELFAGDADWQPRVERFCAKTFELVSFLVDVLNVTSVTARFSGTVTYHDACSGLRELGIRAQPRRLLAGVEGLDLAEMRDADVCCGFGGTFCVKYPDISNAIVAKKADHIAATGAGTLDRKSTRLNSSHLGISYAVFCLKKKKKNQDVNKSQAISHLLKHQYLGTDCTHM